MTTKIQRLTHGQSGYIIPAPDFEITFEGSEGVMIECPEQRADYEVLGWIVGQCGGNWIMAIWKVTLGGIEKMMPNPHLNNRGLWAYLVRKA